jgi:ABC-type amino acid transport substrate-binding protein
MHECVGIDVNQTCPSQNRVGDSCIVKIAFVPQELFAYPVLGNSLQSQSAETFEEEKAFYDDFKELYPNGFVFNNQQSKGCPSAGLPCPVLGVDMDLIAKMFKDFFPGWQFSLVAYESFPAAIYAARVGDVDLTWCAAAVTTQREACLACPEAAAGIAARSENLCCLDFSIPYFEGGLAVVSKTKDKSEFWDALLTHRMLNVCMLFGALLFITGHIMWALECTTETGSVNFPRPYFAGVFQGIYWSCTTATTVGYGDTGPSHTVSKIFSMGWMWMGIIMSGIMMGMISSAMTVQVLAVVDIESLNQLDGQRVCFVPGYYEEYMATEGARVIASKASTIVECVEKLASGSVDAILYDKPALDRYMNLGRIKEGFGVSDLLLNVGYGVAFSEGSDLTHRMSAAILAILDDDLFMTKLRKSWLGETGEETQAPEDTVNWYFLVITCSFLGCLILAVTIDLIRKCLQSFKENSAGDVEGSADKSAPTGDEEWRTAALSAMENKLRDSFKEMKAELKVGHDYLERTDEMLMEMRKTDDTVRDMQTQVVKQAEDLVKMQREVGELTCRVKSGLRLLASTTHNLKY